LACGGESKKVLTPHPAPGRLLADWITARLREAILEGVFKPGEKLDQERIAENLEVSLTPVREALRRLESKGFVELRPHYGAFIANVSREDIQQVYEVRGLLESEIVRQVTSLIPDSVLDELDRSLTEIQAQSDTGDTAKHFESDVDFHETIVSHIQNKLFKDVLDALTGRISMVRRFALLQPGPHLAESLEEHRAILEAMRQRNPQQAAELMRAHLSKSSLRIQELVQQ
jgi:DNA-binding GntR family transcriptional regulator